MEELKTMIQKRIDLLKISIEYCDEISDYEKGARYARKEEISVLEQMLKMFDKEAVMGH